MTGGEGAFSGVEGAVAIPVIAAPALPRHDQAIQVFKDEKNVVNLKQTVKRNVLVIAIHVRWHDCKGSDPGKV